MAREVTVTYWCDQCLAESDERVEGETFVLTLPGMKAPKSVDLCADHRAELLDPVERLMAEYGKAIKADDPPKVKVRKNAPPRPDARRYAVPINEDIGPVFCHIPDCGGYTNKRGYRNIAQVQRHVRQIHPEVGWEEYLTRYGEPKTGDRPPSQEEQLELGGGEGEEVFACEECGKTYTYEDTTKPAQALGVHRAKVHGIRGTKHRPQQAEAS